MNPTPTSDYPAMKQQQTPLPSLSPPWDRVYPLVTRMTVWGILAAVIYVLRSFFLLVFLTFVFAYIQSSGGSRLRGTIRNRIARVTLVFCLLLGTLTAVGLFVIPNAQRQAESFASQFPTYLQKTDETLAIIGQRYPILYRIMPELRQEDGTTASPRPWDFKQSQSLLFLQNLSGLAQEETPSLKIEHVLSILAGVGTRAAAISSAFLLSLLFSFLIVLDMPRLTANIRELRETRLRFIYDEVADNVSEFALVLGRAFEAQLFIAVINTILTGVGIYLLGLGKKVAFLSVIVFFSSFVPVVGVFLSSIPICLVALQTSGGLNIMLMSIVMITVIHLIEGYILNPRIYGSRMHLNPVIVLIILTVSGKIFHFWGLILGIPVYTYVFGHAIRYKKKPPSLPSAEAKKDEVPVIPRPETPLPS